MGLHQIKSAQQKKQQKEKAICGLGENICKPYVQKRANIHIKLCYII